MKRTWAFICGSSLGFLSCRGGSEGLPPLPSFARQNEASVASFVEADRRARGAPASADLAGRLGMLYHAYRFLPQARRCYELARAIDREDLRWIFYAAKLEKTAFRYEAGEKLFLAALERRPGDAEIHAELGDLYLMWNRREEAARELSKALELEPLQPLAVLGKARLLSIDQRWAEVIERLTPLLERYPRLSKAHQYLAAAYGALGMEDERRLHQEEGEYGTAAESARMRELHDLAVDAILEGDAAPGRALLQVKCARCHDHERIYDHDEDRLWWARTVRRMQREAGWDWLTDEEAASVAAYLSITRGMSNRGAPAPGTGTHRPSR